MTERSPKAVLDAHGLRAKHHFGQNFMADANIARRIAELATTPPGGAVVEIGAGLGALTTELCRRAAHVTAIERDRDLVPILRESCAADIDGGRLTVLEADAKRADYAGLFAGGPRPHTLAGNLPYHLTGPLLEAAVHAAHAIDRVVILVQLEVADRLAAKPGTGEYGALSVFVNAAYIAERAFVVRRGAFYPQPRVDSAVVHLTRRNDPVEETDVFRRLVHAAFAQRRKKLRNAWSGLPGVTGEAVGDAARRAGVDLDARGETLDVDAFARMARAVSS